MRFLRQANWLRVLAVIAFLCFVGQGVTAELEHLGLVPQLVHPGGHSHESDLPNDDNPAQHEHTGHHHLSEMIFFRVEIPLPRESVSSHFFPDIHCKDGPVFGIEYPPQLS